MTRHTLGVWFVGSDVVSFAGPRPGVVGLAMDTAEHEAMGSPEDITVTIEPDTPLDDGVVVDDLRESIARTIKPFTPPGIARVALTDELLAVIAPALDAEHAARVAAERKVEALYAWEHQCGTLNAGLFRKGDICEGCLTSVDYHIEEAVTHYALVPREWRLL